jgi:hypothetical protein
MAALAAIWQTRRDIPEKMHQGCGGIRAVCNAELDKLSVQKIRPVLRATMAGLPLSCPQNCQNSLDGEM